jgi:hypothetical protein
MSETYNERSQFCATEKCEEMALAYFMGDFELRNQPGSYLA